MFLKNELFVAFLLTYFKVKPQPVVVCSLDAAAVNGNGVFYYGKPEPRAAFSRDRPLSTR